MLKSTRRALIGAIASAPIVVTLASQAKAAPVRLDANEWDRSLDEYLSARDAYENDRHAGALRKAYDAHDRGTKPPNLFMKAEEHHHEKFGVPREAALQKLIVTPAPTLAALKQKVWIAESEFIGGDDLANGAKILTVIGDDLARLMVWSA
jgi:hypothetical protein